jgi:hypothetical protein
MVRLQVGHPVTERVTDRQKAFIVQFYRRFGRENFDLAQIQDVEFDETIASTYNLSRLGSRGKLPRQDDLTALTKHLGQRGLLVHLNGSKSFRLSETGAEIAEAETAGAEAL